MRKPDRNGRPPKILLGISGGKDSCYLLHQAVRKYNLDVLAYTFDNGFFADGARDNVRKIVEALGVPHRYVSVGDELNRRIYRNLLKSNCSDFCMPCANGSLVCAFNLAREVGADIILWGLCPRTEPILPLEFLSPYDYRYMVDAAGQGLSRDELEIFAPCKLQNALMNLTVSRIRVVFMPEYVEWNEIGIRDVLRDEYGWVDHGAGTPHFDCVVNEAVNYFQNRRLGVSKVAERLSQMVRTGQMTRDEALVELDREDCTTEPTESVDAVCDRLGLTREDIRPWLDGTARDFRAFKGYSRLFHRLSPLFLLAAKLGLTSESLYQKYRL